MHMHFVSPVICGCYSKLPTIILSYVLKFVFLTYGKVHYTVEGQEEKHLVVRDSHYFQPDWHQAFHNLVALQYQLDHNHRYLVTVLYPLERYHGFLVEPFEQFVCNHGVLVVPFEQFVCNHGFLVVPL